MEYVPVDDVESERPASGVDRRGLSDPLGTTDVAINRYRAAPGEGLPGGLHAHADQEEVFVVLEGEATFTRYEPRSGSERSSGETARDGLRSGPESAIEGAESGGPRSGSEPASDEVVIGAGEAVRFVPGEFQSGRNDSGEDLVVLALGAPRESEDVRLPVDCPECGHPELRMDTDGGMELVCPDCGVGHVPAPCPECGDEDLRVALAGRATEGDESGGTVVACRGCDATFEAPPFRG